MTSRLPGTDFHNNPLGSEKTPIQNNTDQGYSCRPAQSPDCLRTPLASRLISLFYNAPHSERLRTSHGSFSLRVLRPRREDNAKRRAGATAGHDKRKDSARLAYRIAVCLPCPASAGIAATAASL